MKQNNIHRPDFLIEISWEVCQRIGGIHTVIKTKAHILESLFGINYILIGPDIQRDYPEEELFTEDNRIFSQWVAEARRQGLIFRVGRWLIPGNPIAILVDYSQYYLKKDSIFYLMWEKYKLDSLSGGWDYIEPALFGYAAAQVVKSFYDYYINAYDKFVVHLHEWKTGLALLEIKAQIPQAAVIFTTHDSVPGRVVSAANVDIFSQDIDVEEIITRNGKRSHYALERLCLMHADCYTAVSKIHADEMKRFYDKSECLITKNGFRRPVAIQNIHEYKAKNRQRIYEVLYRIFGKSPSDDALLVIHSGRYEIRNKGTDVVLDAFGKFKEQLTGEQREIILLLSVPANHSGAVDFVKIREEAGNFSVPIVTHHLLAYDEEPIIQKIHHYHFNQTLNDKVKIIFIPAWLDGNDGVFNMHYYEVLSACDVGLFPSLYEPWGYTPMEALFYGVMSLTTDRAGFGLWYRDQFDDNQILRVISRNVHNDEETIAEIIRFTDFYYRMPREQYTEYIERTQSVLKHCLWDEFIHDYYQAYHRAIEMSLGRQDLYQHKQAVQVPVIQLPQEIKLHKIFVRQNLPDVLKPLQELAQNLWWSWNDEAQQLFASIHPQLWDAVEHNPLTLLEMIDLKLIQKLAEDKQFLAKLNKVYKEFREYMSLPPDDEQPLIAYFCMEYGIHASVKLYSGGLGILAGDYLKEASDLNKKMVAVGLLYRYGYFHQKISTFGDQISEHIPQKFSHLPISPVTDAHGNWVAVHLNFPGRTVHARVWKMPVGRVTLYLLDTDFEDNNDYDRSITHQLYGGDWENRLKQELLLGIGGVRMLRKLGLQPDIYHLNEGHAAFLNLERLRYLIHEEKLNFDQAVEVLRASSIFTTHTPVAAGHDTFDESLLRIYLSHYPRRFNITWEQFMGLGRANPSDTHEKFSMSILALKLSQECNGVSRLHGSVSRNLFRHLYPGLFPEELHIGHVTNGVHVSTWAASQWRNLIANGKTENIDLYLNRDVDWKHIYHVPDEEIWNLRQEFKSKFRKFLAEKIVKDYTQRQENPQILLKTLEQVQKDTLIIGFARRFATYKRAHLLFMNPDRLRNIVNDPLHPVLFVFAGKAHPSDGPGQELIKRIINWSKQPDFLGKIIFLDNYDSEIARQMVQSVDVWLNTPTRPMEASGTSGQKCILNGVLHFSVLDGWWAEAYLPEAGWALKESKTYADQQLQDELDAETIYYILENELIPLYYKRNKSGIPTGWIQFIKKSMCEIAPNFTTRRMINDYYKKYYLPMHQRVQLLTANNYEKAITLASWKRETSVLWNNLKIVDVQYINLNLNTLLLGESFEVRVSIDTAGIDPEHILVEIVFVKKEHDSIEGILFTEKLECTQQIGSVSVFSKNIEIRRAGVHNFGIRIMPQHPLQMYKTDFPLVLWA